MNDKGHFLISIAKSFLRILACMFLMCGFNIVVFATLFLFAEFLGVAEEVFDKR